MINTEKTKTFYNWNTPDPQLLSITAMIAGLPHKFEPRRLPHGSTEEDYIVQRFLLLSPQLYQAVKRCFELVLANKCDEVLNDSISFELKRNAEHVQLQISKSSQIISNQGSQKLMAPFDFQEYLTPSQTESDTVAVLDMILHFHKMHTRLMISLLNSLNF